MNTKPNLIVALDQMNRTEALRMIDALSASGVQWFKVGLELFVKEGPKFVEEVKSKNVRIFLDLKLFDIPNTVHHAVRSAVDLGVDLLTVHCSGGSEMLSAAQGAVKGSATKLLGVTVLTSFSDETLNQVFHSTDRCKTAAGLATIALSSGLRGFVCSVPDLQQNVFKKVFTAVPTSELSFVTPGIRQASDHKNDQQSIATPRAALEAGATHLVVGRPITQAPGKSPENAAQEFLKMMELN